MTTTVNEIQAATSDFEVLYPSIGVDNLGRVKLVRFGEEYSAPGTCAVCVCTLSPDKFFVDLGLTIDDIGAVYLCNICMAETIKVMRCISVDGPEFTKLFNGYTNAVAEVGRLRLELKRTEDKIRHDILADLRNYLGDGHRLSYVVDSGVMADVSTSDDKVNESINSGATASQPGTSSDGQVNRLNSQQGSTGVFDLADLENLKF